MDRRDVLGWLSAGAAAGCLDLFSGPAPRGPDGRAAAVGGPRPAPAEDHRHHDDPHRPQSRPAGHRQGLDQRAGPLRPGLRDVHPAGPRRADGRREVPEALPDRPRRRPDRGYLAVVLRQLVLAERPGAVQRDERRGHGALGHQGQAGEHARLSIAGRQVPVRRRAVCPRPAAATSRRSRTTPAHAMAKGYRHIRVQVGIPGLATYGTAPPANEPANREVDRADQPQEHLGARPLPAHRAQAVRAPARRRWATTSSCSTTSTSGSRPARRSTCARSWRSTTCSSWKTRCRPRRRTTSG